MTWWTDTRCISGICVGLRGKTDVSKKQNHWNHSLHGYRGKSLKVSLQEHLVVISSLPPSFTAAHLNRGSCIQAYKPSSSWPTWLTQVIQSIGGKKELGNHAPCSHVTFFFRWARIWRKKIFDTFLHFQDFVVFVRALKLFAWGKEKHENTEHC